MFPSLSSEGEQHRSWPVSCGVSAPELCYDTFLTLSSSGDKPRPCFNRVPIGNECESVSSHVTETGDADTAFTNEKHDFKMMHGMRKSRSATE